jgi:hypothetical protein
MPKSRAQRVFQYRHRRATVMYDRKRYVDRISQLRSTERVTNREQMDVLAFISGDINAAASLVGVIDHNVNFRQLRDRILYPKLKQTSKTLRRCRRLQKRMRAYDQTAKVVRDIFGDVSDHILEFLFFV